MLLSYDIGELVTGRSPHGERGLKWFSSDARPSLYLSLPARGAWVEIDFAGYRLRPAPVAPRTGSVG